MTTEEVEKLRQYFSSYTNGPGFDVLRLINAYREEKQARRDNARRMTSLINRAYEYIKSANEMIGDFDECNVPPRMHDGGDPYDFEKELRAFLHPSIVASADKPTLSIDRRVREKQKAK